MPKGNVPFWDEKAKKSVDNMPTKPGTYRPDNTLREGYAKMQTKESVQRDIGNSILSPKEFKRKQAAKKSGGFKGFKI